MFLKDLLIGTFPFSMMEEIRRASTRSSSSSISSKVQVNCFICYTKFPISFSKINCALEATRDKIVCLGIKKIEEFCTSVFLIIEYNETVSLISVTYTR